MTKLGRVRRFFSSPRRRRRALKVGIVLAVAALAAIAGVFFSNTGHSNETPFTKGKVQLVAPNPKTVKLSKGDAHDVLVVAAQFVATAVLRNHTERSYDLSDAALEKARLDSRADVARSVRLLRAFHTEQVAPDAYYTALARDTVRQLSQYAGLY